ncbi:MAG TPA: MmcQ/YjbR family DNA-binding protein [Allosphingosinicella sp.]|uniref:MmcQ/YjbR family DNA-binding protein n=1 Tax=Allosphingosinicella sp. TaxID=2823234 RepID=UPI002ED77715
MTSLKEAYDALRAYGLDLPEAVEEMPWGHSALKVRGRSFVFLNLEEDRLSLSMKLPVSRDFALIFDFTEPTGYGLGRSGWVTSSFAKGDEIDLDLMKRWIVESYRAFAPKKLSKLLPAED